MQSREWRLGSLYRIVDEQGISVQFRPNDVQRALWDELWFWNLILKGRQHGISTFICLLMLDSCLFAPNTHCGLFDATLAPPPRSSIRLGSHTSTCRLRSRPLCRSAP